MFLRISVIIILAVFLILNSSFLNCPEEITPVTNQGAPPFMKADSIWVDSVFNTLTPDERIAQLFMYPAYSNKTEQDYAYIENLIREYKIGGLIFMQGGPVRQAILINRYQEASNVPLLVATDAEWGLSMRLDSTIVYPNQIMLGAITDEQLIYEFGKTVGKECKRVGVNVNFAPVIDVNNNPLNPVIGYRSFGEDKKNVARKGYFYMKGLQDENVLAVGKHFPGHGDTDTDSHLALPVINHSVERLDSIELYPFIQLIDQGVGGIMVAHLFIPSLDSTKNTATTLSYNVVTKLLKQKLNYKGLIFTDALNMKGVSSFNKPGEIDVKALLAGNDVLLFPADIPEAMDLIKLAILDGEISQKEIDDRCRKILKVKYWAGLNNYKPIVLENLYKDINNPQSELLKRKLVENSITLLKNDSVLPINGLDTLKIASVVIGTDAGNEFQRTLNLYTKVDKYAVTKRISTEERARQIKLLSEKYNLVIVSFHGTSRKPSENYGIKDESVLFAEELADSTDVIIDIFGNPYILASFKNPKKFKAIIISYNDWKLTQNISAQAIFGGIPISGKLPVGISEDFKVGTGININDKIRLKYSDPEESGMDGSKLNMIDTIVDKAIKARATPGCQVLVARNGTVVFYKAYGCHKYDCDQKVEMDDMYDLASITKIAATTISVMKLVEDGVCNLDSCISKYLTYLDTTDKKKITIRQIMTHQARLKPWIPFYLQTLRTDSLINEYYRTVPDSSYSIMICEGLYLRSDYRDTIFRRIAESELLKKSDYKYSDLGFYWLYQIVEKLSEQPFDKFVYEKFYHPLGASTLCFTPLTEFNDSVIVPTEIENYFRNKTVDGYVHDMGAAMIGGVCGHAGLFSNANDLAKLMQMLLDKGNYGGIEYFKPETIDIFNTCGNCPKSRRGIGFDKPEMSENVQGPASKSASAESFGHTGFTGTIAWVDPVENLVFIFLSNRTYPDMNNKTLMNMNVRTDIQDIIYKSIIK
ncbi:MAG: glycoside hydrolase family 3 N-terminal domain-containing protein [Bacteroidota bacterium]